MISRIHSKPLKGATIKAELYKVCTSIRLANVTESSHYSEEFMALYFESKNSGGGDQKKVNKVELLGNGAAVVFFDDPEGTITHIPAISGYKDVNTFMVLDQCCSEFVLVAASYVHMAYKHGLTLNFFKTKYMNILLFMHVVYT